MNELDSITLNVGNLYKDKPKTLPGFTTYVDGSVDTSTPGTYTLTYTLIKTDPAFETESYFREVTVQEVAPIDHPAPEITLIGDAFYNIDIGEPWTDPGATASVETSPGVFEDVTVYSFSSVDIWPNAEAGTYQVVYYAISSNNKIGFAMRTVKVGVTHRDLAGDLVAPGFTLDGCEKFFVEYPSGTTKPIYVGSEYSGVGNHIIKDEGFTLEDPDDPTFTRMSIIVEDTSNETCTRNYPDKASCELAGGTWGYESTFPELDEVYMEADDVETRTYNINYTINDIHGNVRTRVRTVVMLAEGVQADELEDQIAYGCLLNDDNADIGDVLQDEDTTNDPHDSTDEPTIPDDDISQDTLNVMCAGDTAFFGGVPHSTRLPHPNEIPETIIETRYASETVQGWATLFTNTYEILMPDGSSKEVKSKGTVIWRLHKIHNRNLVTYSTGLSGFGGASSSNTIFSSFHINSDGDDVFYGRWGTHIFSDPPGWGNSVRQKSVSWSGGRVLPAPASFTEVTSDSNSAWLTKVQESNVADTYIFNDPNRLTLSNGGWANSNPFFRGIDNAVAAGGPSEVGDVLSLHWHNFSGGRNVAEYCNFTWTAPEPPAQVGPTLNLYCDFPIETNPGTSSPSSGYVVPHTLHETEWTEEPCYQNNACSLVMRNARLDNIDIKENWVLKTVSDTEAVYQHSSNGTLRSMTNSGSNSVTFTGMHATYTFSSWEYGNNGPGSHKWMTNFTSPVSSGSKNISLTTTWSPEFYNPWTNQGALGVTRIGTINNCV